MQEIKKNKSQRGWHTVRTKPGEGGKLLENAREGDSQQEKIQKNRD